MIVSQRIYLIDKMLLKRGTILNMGLTFNLDLSPRRNTKCKSYSVFKPQSGSYTKISKLCVEYLCTN